MIRSLFVGVGLNSRLGGAEPEPPRSLVSVLVRRVVRCFTALGETRLQLILAAFITVGATLWAWILVAAAFAGPPKLAELGVIGVAVEASSQTSRAPIEVYETYKLAADRARGNYDLFFNQRVSEAARKQLSPTIIVFLCGPIAQHPDFTDFSSQPVHWRVPRSPAAHLHSTGLFGTLSDCVYTTMAMRPPGQRLRDALIEGSFGTATSDVSGTKVLYALPAIGRWFTQDPINGLNSTEMPPGSTLTVQLTRDPTVDLTNTIASPQFTDAGTLTWTGALVLPRDEYRVEADSQEALSLLQFHLFLAGVLVGIAGGTFVWFVQTGVQAGYRAIAGRDKRAKPGWR